MTNNKMSALFFGTEPTKQLLKSLDSQVQIEETKSLTRALENFQKEINNYLTECIEKNSVPKPSGIPWQTENSEPYYFFNHFFSLNRFKTRG